MDAVLPLIFCDVDEQPVDSRWRRFVPPGENVDKNQAVIGRGNSSHAHIPKAATSNGGANSKGERSPANRPL